MPLRILSLDAWGGRVYAPLLRYLVTSDVDVTFFAPVAAPEVSDHRALLLEID